MRTGWTGFGFKGVRLFKTKKKKRRRNKKKSKMFKDSVFADRASVACHWCGKTVRRSQATTDHVRALSKGGHDRKKNYKIACKQCNHDKRALPAGTFMQRLRGEIKPRPKQPVNQCEHEWNDYDGYRVCWKCGKDYFVRATDSSLFGAHR